MVELLKIYKTAIEASVEAGIAIMEVFNSNDFGVEIKQDNSPVTKADIASSNIITSHLQSTNIPTVGEEREPEEYSVRKTWSQLWIIDPLDGTKEFVKKTNEFTVNIALVEKGVPVFGVIYVPVSKEIFFGGEAMGSYKLTYQENVDLETQLQDSQSLPIASTEEGVVVVTGGRETEFEFYKNSPRIQNLSHMNFQFVKLSSSLKFCRIAEGVMDLYPRDYPCMEWDTAAGHAIVNGIGKDIYDIATNQKVIYNKENLYNPYFLVV